MKNPSTGNKVKNTTVMYALLRNAGAMKHKLEPQGGSTNNERNLIDEHMQNAKSVLCYFTMYFCDTYTDQDALLIRLLLEQAEIKIVGEYKPLEELLDIQVVFPLEDQGKEALKDFLDKTHHVGGLCMGFSKTEPYQQQ